MRNPWRRLLAWLADTWLYRAPAPRFTATGPVYLGGSVRADLQPETIENRPVGITEGEWLHAFEGPIWYATVDELCGAKTWGEP